MKIPNKIFTPSKDTWMVVIMINLLVFLLASYYKDLNILLNLRIYILILYYISFILFIFSAFKFITMGNLNNAYNKGGVLYKWYDLNLSQKGTKWISNLFDKLEFEKLLNTKGEKLIVSGPSANKGVYEKVLFNHLCSKKIRCKFIISDYNQIDNHEENSINDFGEFIYIPERRDARHIQNILRSQHETYADVILDFSGCLWHIKEDIWYRETQCVNTLLEILELYRNVLRKSSLIIVDNNPTSTVIAFLRSLGQFLAHFKIGTGNYSTGDYIMYIYNKNKYKYFRDYIDKNFCLKTLNVLNELGREQSFLILIKK